MASSQPFPTIVHPFESPNSHARAYETGLRDAKNALVFIGGLGDGPHTVPYPRAIGKHLESFLELSYSVFEFTMKQRVVLIGHSTGCQVYKLSPVTFAYIYVLFKQSVPNFLASVKAADKSRISWNTPPLHTRA